MTGFKDYFSTHASAYAAARPSYPMGMFEWLADISPSRQLVWDAACGNGQASCALAEYFARVYASDASASQIANAVPHPHVEYHCERAELCSLASASVDLVSVAQAAHWLAIDAFYQQVRRVLKPGGCIALWCYGTNNVTADIDQQSAQLYRRLKLFWPPERRQIEEGYSQLPFPFDALPSPKWHMEMHWSSTEYTAYLRSWSAVQRCIQTTNVDPVSAIAESLQSLWGSERRRVRWPLFVHVGKV